MRLGAFLAPERAAGVDIPNRQTRGKRSIIRLSNEKTVPPIEHQRLARQRVQPAAISNAPGKNGVEQLTARGGEQHALLRTRRRFAARKPGTHRIQIAAFMPKALLGKPVRHTDVGDAFQSRV